MDHQPAGVDFALIGHQENWENMTVYANLVRQASGKGEIAEETIRELAPFLPPSKLFDIVIKNKVGEPVTGIYIETFISPDELGADYLYKNLVKVKKACEVAAQYNARVGALGGFSSIILEAGDAGLDRFENTWFTTGNTLSAAYIIKAVEKACKQRNMRLSGSSVLLIGSTGDIGTACVRYFTGKVRLLKLCARRKTALDAQAVAGKIAGQAVITATTIETLLDQTDIVICVASSLLSGVDWNRLPKHALICDAGYPKNLISDGDSKADWFYGGMGTIKDEYQVIPGYADALYRFVIPGVLHGCLLEGIVLSMAKEYRAFSKGRGNISLEAMDYIVGLAHLHGIEPAPLFNKRQKL